MKIVAPLRSVAVGVAATAAMGLAACHSEADMTPAAPALVYETVTVQKSDFSFSGPDGAVACSADTQRIKVGGDSAAIAKINMALSNTVAPPCSADLLEISGRQTVTYNAGNIFSVAADRFAVPQGGNGSCHGESLGQTFDAGTGAELKLKDIVAPADLPKVYAVVASEIAKASTTGVGEIARDLIKSEGNLGLIVKDAQVRVQANAYYSSCADGPDFTGAVPQAYIRHPLLKTLQKMAP